MKMFHLIYIVWCLLRSAEGVIHEDKLRDSDNTLIEGLALENLELEDADSKLDSYIEMLSDFEDAIKEEYFKDHEVDGVLSVMSHNEFEGQDQHVADPVRFPEVPNPWGPDPPRLAHGHGHKYCGPYTYHYTKGQDCHEVGIHYHKDDSNQHITIKECEDLCEAQYRCNAYAWAHKPQLGCVLRECGYSDQQTQPMPFPMPIGRNPDFISFSKYKPDDIPECQHPVDGASYVTPNNYCGPYYKTWRIYPNRPSTAHLTGCAKIIHHPIYKVDPLQCETHCDTRLECTGFIFDPSEDRCILVACTGYIAQPKPTLDPKTQSEYFSYTIAYSKDRVPDLDCRLDDRTIRV